MKRLIIRSFFVASLIFFVTLWGMSISYSGFVRGQFSKVAVLARTESDAGTLEVGVGLWEPGYSEVKIKRGPFSSDTQGSDCWGIDIRLDHNGCIVEIRYWLLSTATVLSLMLVWRKTRQPVKGRAFP